ncbi:hypothetical protein HOO65_050001, partial [Ceratocystis lukuohia]
MSDESSQESPETRTAILSQLSEMSGRQATTQMGPSLTKEERVKKLQNVIDILVTHQTRDGQARHLVADEFEDWTVEDWRDLDGGRYNMLRSNLILHGLYVPHHRITGSMMNSIEVASRPADEWTDEMMKQYAEIPMVYTGSSALQERLTKEKVPRDLWNVRQWILGAETQGARPTQERVVRVEQPKQGNVTKGTQDVRRRRRDQSPDGRRRGNAGAEAQLGCGAGEKTGGRDFAHFEYRTPSLHSNAYEIEQRKILGLLEKTWPEENQFSGAMDSVSLWRRFRSFVHKCSQLGLEEHYLHDGCGRRARPLRSPYKELVITTAATDWKSVMIQMEQRFENAGMKLARDNRWLQYTLDEFIRDKAVSLPAYHGHGILRDRLLLNLRQHHATARESSRYGYSNMTALDVATHVCDAPKAELQAATVERKGQQLSQRGSAFMNRPMSAADVDAHVEQLLADRRFSKPKLYGRQAPRKCFICHKEGHFMSKHTKAERDKHMAEWRTKKPSGPAHVYAMDAVDMEHGSLYGCVEEEEEVGPDQTMEAHVTWVDDNGRETLDALDDNKFVRV